MHINLGIRGVPRSNYVVVNAYVKNEKSSMVAQKMPFKRWFESDSVIKETPNHQRFQLDDDSGRSMQLEQARLNLKL